MSRWGLAGALSAALLLAACGDDDAGDANPPIPPAPVGETVAPAPVATPPLVIATPNPVEPVAAPAPAQPTVAAAPPPAAVPITAPVAGRPAGDADVPVTPVPATAVAPASPAVAPAAEIAPAAPRAATTPAPTPAPPAPAAAVPAAANAPATPDDLLALIRAADPAAGEALAAQCGICHTFEAGGATRIGPNLYDIVGAPIARDPTFTYSPAMVGLAATGGMWTFERLDAFLADPAATVPGTRMTFAGIAADPDRAAVLAWLRSLSTDPEAVGGPRIDGRNAAVAAGLAPLAFTEEQALAGRDYLNRNCARCHGGNLLGLINENEWGEAPAIVGPAFEQRWFGQPVSDLFAFLANDPRTDYHGGLTDERYADVLAYLAERNGLVAGAVALPQDEAALQAIGFYQ